MDKRTLRSKRGRPRNARQYDRPNQGIFGKVYSTMKGILQPTSWIFNSVSNWIGNNSEEKPPTSCADIEEETVREDNDIVSQSVSHGNKRLRLRFDDNIPSIQSSGTQTWPDQPSQNLYDSVSHVQSSTTQTSLLDNKESIAVLNGDDHSENSEGSASTSGCSSLVSSHKDSNKLVESPFHSLRSGLKNNRKRKEPSKSELDELNSNRTLWSSTFGVSSKCQRRFPTISHTNQPSFNLSTFVGPSKLNESVDKKITSPFYEGRTTFGGASASRRMPPSVAPYQVDKSLRNQIKVREHNSEDNLEGMSSAAKRILLTLEKMSTPVADAKKIPNTKTSPVDLSVYLTPPKSRRNSQFTPTISNKGPPIANINTIAKLATLKNYGVSRLRNTLPSNSLASVGQEGYNFDNLQPNSSDSVVQKSGGGKMKSKLNQHHQSSKDINGENRVLETPDLPNIPLPISKLPTINFGAKVEKTVESNHSAKGFTFSNPIEHDLAINNAVSTSSFALPSSFDSKTEKNSDLQPKSFVFSSPIEHELPNINVLPKENAPLPVISTSGGVSSQSTWECSACWVRNTSSRNSCIACETSRAPKENISASVKVTAGNPVLSNFTSVPSTSAFTFSQSSSLPVFTFGKSKASEAVTPSTFTFGSDSKTATWECTSCWVKNLEKDSKCIACETVRVKKDNINTKTADASSASNTAMWECSECWVRNSAKESKCLACESPRSPKENNQGSTSVVNTTDKWECGICWVKNPSNESKCIACESARSSKGNAEVKSSSSNVFSTWECTSCWVRNPMTEKKCKACETLHPSADKSSGFKDTNGFKFSSPIQNSPITFKFGNYVCTSPSTVTTSTFKFGIATSEPQTTTSTTTSGFNCGAPSKTSTSSFFSTPAITDSTQNSKGIINENSSTNTGTDKVNEDSPKLDTVNENTEIIKVTEKGGFTAKTSEATSIQSGGSEVTNPLLASKSTENKVSNSVITNTSSETFVSKAKEVVTPSVTACFSFTTQPLLDSKKSETFPFGDQRKKKVSSQSSSSPFTVFPTPSKDKSAEDEKSLHPENKNTDTTSENKLSSVFQPVSQSQQVSSAFTALTNAPVFKFGEKADSSKNNLSTTSVTTTTPSFSFSNSLSNYATVTDSKASEIDSAVSETVPPAPAVKTDDKVTSVTVSSASTTSSFVFGNNGTSSTPSAFSFFPPSSTSTAPSTVFTFGASSNTAQTSKSGGFTFKGLEKPPNVTSISSATPVSSTQTTTSVLNLGTSAAVPGGGFVFGTPKTEAQSTAATPFAFGSGTASLPSMSAFSAFQPSQSANTAFQFGSQPTGSTSSTIGTSSNFAFAKSEMSNQVPSSASQNPVAAFGSPASNFVFGAKSETANQIPSSTGSQAPSLAFGSATNSFTFTNKTENTSTASQNPNPTFGSSMPSLQCHFGSTPVVTPFGSTDKPASSGFNFGGVSTSGVFQFGATNNTTERKRPAAAASGFSFGTRSASEPTPSFQANFSMNTPPSFNFGATSMPAGPGPFQFAASSASKSSTTQNAPRKYRKALRRVRKD